MERIGNVNVKEYLSKKNINVKANVIKHESKAEAQRRWQALQHAKHLQEKFGPVADNSLAFLRKCFNRMSEDRVWQLYESATRKNAHITNPFAYFIGAAKAQPEMSD